MLPCALLPDTALLVFHSLCLVLASISPPYPAPSQQCRHNAFVWVNNEKFKALEARFLDAATPKATAESSNLEVGPFHDKAQVLKRRLQFGIL